MSIRRGTVRAYDQTAHTASVELWGAQAQYLAGVPVSHALGAWLLVEGAECGVVFFDESDAQDACLAFIYGGAPPSDGRLLQDGARQLLGNLGVASGVTIDGVDVGKHSHNGTDSALVAPPIYRAVVTAAVTLSGQANTWYDVSDASLSFTVGEDGAGVLFLLSAVVRHSSTGKVVSLRTLLDDTVISPPAGTLTAYLAAGGTRESLCWASWLAGLAEGTHTLHCEAQSDSMTSAYVDRLELLAIVFGG